MEVKSDKSLQSHLRGKSGFPKPAAMLQFLLRTQTWQFLSHVFKR